MVDSRRHLAYVLDEYCLCNCSTSCVHQGVRQRIPAPTALERFNEGASSDSSSARRGLRHDYKWLLNSWACLTAIERGQCDQASWLRRTTKKGWKFARGDTSWRMPIRAVDSG